MKNATPLRKNCLDEAEDRFDGDPCRHGAVCDETGGERVMRSPAQQIGYPQDVSLGTLED